jgi:hypothetical protein
MIPNERPTPLTDESEQRMDDIPIKKALSYFVPADFARTLERSLAAVTAERDALKHALIELESASEAYAADQSRATDSRCGLVQPITVEDGNRLLSALKIANELTK